MNILFTSDFRKAIRYLTACECVRKRRGIYEVSGQQFLIAMCAEKIRGLEIEKFYWFNKHEIEKDVINILMPRIMRMGAKQIEIEY